MAKFGVLFTRCHLGKVPENLRYIQQFRRQRPLIINDVEALQLMEIVESVTAKIQGDLAEVGVAFGASASLIGRSAPGRTVHLFDTFSGLPEPGESDSGFFKPGMYACGLDEVKAFLNSDQFVFHQGMFPADTGDEVADKTFSFVHLDVDLYSSTLDALRFFYPRMQPGGMILSHDYHEAQGVTAAFDEFFSGRPEAVLALVGGDQALVVKQ
jgi:hypothetical protein